MSRPEIKKPERVCAGCGTKSDDAGNLTLLEDNRYHPMMYLCRALGRGRGHREEPKAACLARWFTSQRELTCLVCEGELFNYAHNRARPICKDCEVKIAALREGAKGKRWYAFDTWELFGNVIPRGVHADYSNLGAQFLEALGDLGPRINGAEWITPEIERRHTDRYVNATIELTDRQAEGVRGFAAKFREVVQAIADAKHAEGGSLLVKLARGEVSVDDFDQQVAAKGDKR